MRSDVTGRHLRALAEVLEELEREGVHAQAVDSVDARDGGIRADIEVWLPTDFKPLSEEEDGQS